MTSKVLSDLGGVLRKWLAAKDQTFWPETHEEKHDKKDERKIELRDKSNENSNSISIFCSILGITKLENVALFFVFDSQNAEILDHSTYHQVKGKFLRNVFGFKLSI